MNIVGCLDVPTSGHYRLDGVNIRHLDDVALSRIRNKKIGFVFQGFNLIPRMSAIHNVELPMAYSGVKPAERRKRAVVALEMVGLGDRLSHFSSELSGGQQQRVAIARAMCTNPSLILADEPTGNLDSRSSAELMSLFTSLHDQGRTIVMITHEPDIAAYASRVVVLRDGEIVSNRPQDASNAVSYELAPSGRYSFGAAETRADGDRLRESRNGNSRHRVELVANAAHDAGVLIGVASVIVLLAIGTGSSQSIEKSIESLGPTR